MTEQELLKAIRCGETSTIQFKEQFTTTRQVVEEMVAFSNSKGGRIIFGIADKTGEITGLAYGEVQRISHEISTAANDQIRPVVFLETETFEIEGKLVLVVAVKEGVNKPYKDLNGQVWVKQGPDKRKVTENKEILSLFHQSGNYFPDDEPVTETDMDDIDGRALEEYERRVYGTEGELMNIPQEELLKNMHVLSASGQLTLAGLMFFGKNPQRFCSCFNIKAVAFYGNDLGGSEYRDSKDIDGTIPELFEQGMAFLKSNLHSVQAGQSFNSVGKLEIAEIVLEELLQNALVHRDYIWQAPIRIFVFDNRVEIINPGCLPSGLTVEAIKSGRTYRRNPTIADFCSKIMRYRGIGSGIARVMRENEHIELNSDESGNQFRAVVYRDAHVAESAVSTKGTTLLLKTSEKILTMIAENPTVTIREMAERIGLSRRAIEEQMKNLKKNGVVKRVGSLKSGQWLIVE